MSLILNYVSVYSPPQQFNIQNVFRNFCIINNLKFKNIQISIIISLYFIFLLFPKYFFQSFISIDDSFHSDT